MNFTIENYTFKMKLSKYRVFQKCLNRTAKITLAACCLLLLWESCQSGVATHSAVQALMKHSVLLIFDDKGSVRKRTKISGNSIPRFIPAYRYSTIRPYSSKWSPSLIPACRSLRGNTVSFSMPDVKGWVRTTLWPSLSLITPFMARIS